MKLEEEECPQQSPEKHPYLMVQEGSVYLEKERSEGKTKRVCGIRRQEKERFQEKGGNP